jgi:acyl-CoA thioesterase YciA
MPRSLALRIATLPRDTNHYGTIFGGIILAYIDQAGFVQARKHGAHRWVTASLDRVDFKAPVHLGDIINLYTTTIREGTKSVTIAVGQRNRHPHPLPQPPHRPRVTDAGPEAPRRSGSATNHLAFPDAGPEALRRSG